MRYRRLKNTFCDIVDDVMTEREFVDVRTAIYARGKGVYTALSNVPNELLQTRVPAFREQVTNGVHSEIFMCWVPHPLSREYAIFYSYCDAEMLHTMAIQNREYIAKP
ncbi:MAG: hypothetical protein H7Y38_14245 [Armatimonadetes bacterium]|nr:hypothetical protein [Armatimonadota bacterium]